jgi:phosphate transport system substrate-binding protein
LLAGLLVLTSCSEKREDQAQAAIPQGKVVIKGSNTIGEELAPKLIAEYKKDHSNAVFELESKATGYGFAALFAGLCNIAGASRAPIADELEQARSRNIELNDHVIGAYGTVLVVNAANPVTNLTKDQARDIFTGAVQNWKDVGGPDAPIHLCIRDAISGTHLGFKELAMDNKSYGTNRTSFTNYAAIAHAVAQEPNSIGYCGFNSPGAAGVKTISVQGITPSPASVTEGKYPYARTLHFYTDKAKEAAAATEFIQFVQSPKGQDILKELGYMPRS